MENQTKSRNTGWRKNSNRPASFYLRNRMGLTSKEPVHIGYYLNCLLDDSGKVNRENVVKLFNS